MIRSTATGAVFAILLSFPCAAAIALLYRFPIPFGGYASGLDAIPVAMMAVAFYGVTFGGFIVVGALGAIAEVMSHRFAAPRRSWGTTLVPSLVIAFCATFTLAILDKFIGPW